MHPQRRVRGIAATRQDQLAIEAVTPGWHWSKGYRAPRIIIRRGEGTNVTAWYVESRGKHTEVTVQITNGVQVVKTIAKHIVLSEELPALAQKLITQYHQ